MRTTNIMNTKRTFLSISDFDEGDSHGDDSCSRPTISPARGIMCRDANIWKRSRVDADQSSHLYLVDADAGAAVDPECENKDETASKESKGDALKRLEDEIDSLTSGLSSWSLTDLRAKRTETLRKAANVGNAYTGIPDSPQQDIPKGEYSVGWEIARRKQREVRRVLLKSLVKRHLVQYQECEVESKRSIL